MTNILQQWRIKHGFTYEQIGRMIGIKQPSAWKLCHYKRKSFDLELLKKISEITGFSIDEIINSLKEK